MTSRFDDLEPAIKWLLQNLAAHRLLERHLLPRLKSAVEGGFSKWIQQTKAEEIPALILSVSRWLEAGKEPHVLLTTLERALEFYETNKQETGNLSGILLQPLQSHHAMLQCMTTIQLVDNFGSGKVAPPTDDRPDVWCQLTDRQIAIEVTSLGHDAGERAALASGTPSAGSVDPKAEDAFKELMAKTIGPKLAKVPTDAPSVLVILYGNVVNDFLLALEDTDFGQLVAHWAPDLTPLAAVVLIPYSDPCQISFCAPSHSKGHPLKPDEQAALKSAFASNPIVKYGLWPPGNTSG